MNLELFPEVEAIPIPRKGPKNRCFSCGHMQKAHRGLTRHCCMRVGQGQECPCSRFLLAPSTQPKQTKPKVTPWTVCARPGCNHFRVHHCTPGRESLQVKEKPFSCKHFQTWLPTHVVGDGVQPACDSTACAETIGPAGGESFCSCPEFLSPHIPMTGELFPL